MAGPLKILVIGSGSIGRRHHQNLHTLGVDATLLSYRAHGAAQLSGVLDDTDWSGVVIATATHVRADVILMCAQRGLPVYVEKPLAFQQAELDQIYAQSESIANRSMVGFMMRYHPFFKRLADTDLSDVYRFDFTIGHDVTQWRTDWNFADSYAARPAGGGVLLDLCHELDMACCLFPGVKPVRVSCVGHQSYPQVDFSTMVCLDGSSAAHGVVAMDYLSPASTRSAALYGGSQVVRLDFNTLQFSSSDGDRTDVDTISFDRNEMFIDAMKDFLSLIDGRSVSTIKHLPRLDLVRGNCETIARAWAQREFSGKLSEPLT